MNTIFLNLIHFIPVVHTTSHIQDKPSTRVVKNPLFLIQQINSIQNLELKKKNKKKMALIKSEKFQL